MGWNYLSIPKHQWCNSAISSHISLGMWLLIHAEIKANPSMLVKKKAPGITTLRHTPNGQQLTDKTFKYISLNENLQTSNKISSRHVPWDLTDGKSLTDSKSALVQLMAWCQTGAKPLSEPMLIAKQATSHYQWYSLLMHIYFNRPQSVINAISLKLILESLCRKLVKIKVSYHTSFLHNT